MAAAAAGCRFAARCRKPLLPIAAAPRGRSCPAALLSPSWCSSAATQLLRYRCRGLLSLNCCCFLGHGSFWPVIPGGLLRLPHTPTRVAHTHRFCQLLQLLYCSLRCCCCGGMQACCCSLLLLLLCCRELLRRLAPEVSWCGGICRLLW